MLKTFRIIGIILVCLIEIFCLVFCFLTRADVVVNLNSGGLNTLFSLLFLAPMFLLPLFLAFSCSIGYIVFSIINKQWFLLVLQILILLSSIILFLDFLNRSNIK